MVDVPKHFTRQFGNKFMGIRGKIINYSDGKLISKQTEMRVKIGREKRN